MGQYCTQEKNVLQEKCSTLSKVTAIIASVSSCTVHCTLSLGMKPGSRVLDADFPKEVLQTKASWASKPNELAHKAIVSKLMSTHCVLIGKFYQ